MITTITLNPALDKTCFGERMCPGQVNRMDRIRNLPGGKGINVTRVLAGYGFPVRAMGFLGGHTGIFIENGVRQFPAECAFTQISESTRTNTNLITGDGYVTEILEPGPVITETELSRFREDYEKALADTELVVMSGSVPPGISPDIYRELIEKASSFGKRVILDTSKESLREGIKGKPFLIKPNTKELEYLTGRSLRNREEITEAALMLCREGVHSVVVSMGEKGLLYISETERIAARPPKIKAVNTVGCGDTAVASLAMSVLAGEDAKTALGKAAAISAANATTAENGVFSKEFAEELMQKVTVENLFIFS